MEHEKPGPGEAKGALRARLSPMEYEVTQCSATEPPFTGKYWNHKGKGVYKCVVCATALFSSETKFDSGTGWPSFWDGIKGTAIKTVEDRSHGMVRVETRCPTCEAHLGHVFDDGPRPTGLRYCINSAALRFEPGP